MASSPLPLLLLLLLLLLSFTAARHHHHRRTDTTTAAAQEKIQQACQATRFPAVCQATLSNSSLPPNPTTADLLHASFSAPSAHLLTARSLAAAILASSSSDRNRTTAARNCLDLLALSSTRLSAADRSFSTALVDSRAWSSASLLYQYDCWSALKYVNTTQQVNGTMAFLADLEALTSNFLSMLAALSRYGDDVATWGPPQTERGGYWEGNGGGGGPRAVAEVPAGVGADATVCKGGGCRFETVQAAVDAAPEFGVGRFVIYIKEGVYEEIVRVAFEKTNVVFVGDGMGKTIITGNLNAGIVGVSTYNTATVGVVGDGFMARDLTFSNTAGPDAHQAVAFRSDSDFSVLDSVEFSGHQDTLYAHSLRQLYRNCLISGTVDFIFGNSAAVFQNCTILFVPRQLNPEKGETDTVAAHGRTDPAQTTGFVFRNCAVNASAEYLEYYYQKPAAHRAYLGRPWKEYSRTVYIDCYLGVMIRPEGWSPWDGDFALNTLYYGEFGSSGPGANPSARVPWSSQIPAEHLGVYSLQNFIQMEL